MELSKVAALVFLVAASCLLWSGDAVRTLTDSRLLSSEVAASHWKNALQQQSVPREIERLLPTITAGEAEKAARLLAKNALSEAATAKLCAATEMACADEGRYVGNVAIGSQVWYYGPGSALGYYGLPSPSGHHGDHLFFRERDLHDAEFTFRASDAIENWSLQRAFLPGPLTSVLQGPADRALRLLHIPGASRIAAATRGTGHFCGELERAAEEAGGTEKWWQGVATCVASAEELADFVATELVRPSGTEVDALPGTDMDAVRRLDEATVQAVAAGEFRVVGAQLRKGVDGSFVACHVMPSAFQTMLCHSQPSSKLYWAELESTAAPGTVISELAVCHMDTSDWNPDHRSFGMLGTRPGEAEACHWANFGFLALFLEDVSFGADAAASSLYKLA